MNSDVTNFLQKAKQWQPEMKKLRQVLLQTGLAESLKWSKPCYSFGDHNIVIMQPFKNCLGLMYFKGKLLKDPKDVLVDNGPNSQSARRLEFRSMDEVDDLTSIVKNYIQEAIALEKSGLKIEVKKKPAALPAELKAALSKNAKLKKAFSALTPGRQRGYILFFAAAKHSETRTARIKKCAPNILLGKGLHD